MTTTKKKKYYKYKKVMRKIKEKEHKLLLGFLGKADTQEAACVALGVCAHTLIRLRNRDGIFREDTIQRVIEGIVKDGIAREAEKKSVASQAPSPVNGVRGFAEIAADYEKRHGDPEDPRLKPVYEIPEYMIEGNRGVVMDRLRSILPVVGDIAVLPLEGWAKRFDGEGTTVCALTVDGIFSRLASEGLSEFAVWRGPHDERWSVERAEPVSEAVDHPEHYGGGDNPYEAIKVIEAWDLGFSLGNAVKYIARAGKKKDRREDLEKALWYLNRELSRGV